jgi:hypothetical protein
VRLRAVQHGGPPGRLMHRAGPRLRRRAMPSTEDGWVRAGGGCCSVTAPPRRTVHAVLPHTAHRCPAPMSGTDVLDDACLVGKGRRPAAAARWDSNPPPPQLSGRGLRRAEPLSCGSCVPAGAARARQRPAVSDATRTSADQAMSYRKLGKHPRAAPDGLVLQLGGHGQRPWLSVDDRWEPMLRARRGHGRRG